MSAPEQEQAQMAYPAQNSVELTLTAKGLYTWTVKQYHHGDPDSIQECMNRVYLIDKGLRDAYPHPEAGA